MLGPGREKKPKNEGSNKIAKNEIFDFIKDHGTIFEREPLVKLSKNKQLIAFRYDKYWRCMDNLKEKNQLEKIFKKHKTIWDFK